MQYINYAVYHQFLLLHLFALPPYLLNLVINMNTVKIVFSKTFFFLLLFSFFHHYKNGNQIANISSQIQDQYFLKEIVIFDLTT